MVAAASNAKNYRCLKVFTSESNTSVVSVLFKEDHLQCLSLSKPCSLILAVYVDYFPFLNARK